MLSHSNIWAAIDALAHSLNLTASGLARRANLDPTTFNPSKRKAADGRLRWPSTESIAKLLQATQTPLHHFIDLMTEQNLRTSPMQPDVQPVPLLEFSQAGVGSFFDDGGFPAGNNWDEIIFPGSMGESIYALEISGNSMLPLYRSGDIIIVQPGESVRRGDRVVVRTISGKMFARVLQRKTPKTIELLPLNTKNDNTILKTSEVEWLARILWASQ